MQGQKLGVVVLGVLLLGGVVALAASPRTSARTSAVGLVAQANKSSESGRARGTFELVGDATATAGGCAIFRLDATRNADRLLSSTRRVLPLSEVVWPVILTDAEEGVTLATAVFTNFGTAEAPEVVVATSDG